MARNALGWVASAAILSFLAPHAQLSTAPEGEAAREGQAAAASRGQPASDRRGESADPSEEGRRKGLLDLQDLLLQVCRGDQPAPSVGFESTAPEIGGLCQPRPEDFVIATVPDPVHTRLASDFDRAAEVIQQALQDEGYQFVRAVLPWDHRAHAEAATLKDRLAAEQYAKARAENPGLMAFRKDPPPNPGDGHGGAPSRPYLFVLIVGESPTGGIAKRQFVNAVGWITAITGTDCPPLWVLGPTFSGSLVSLADLLDCSNDRVGCHGRTYAFSGSVSSRSAIESFLRKEHALYAAFASFQESTEVIIERFKRFLAGRGYDDASIAIVSEDETKYGGVERKDETKNGG